MQTEFAMSDRPSSPPQMTTSSIQPMRVRQRPKTLDLTPAETIKLIEKSIRIPPENSISLTITPVVAEHVLKEFNHHNRTKKPSKIALYAADMKKKDWRETAEAIKFSDIGFLRDGQNRLYACILAQTSFETSVAFGLPDNSFAKMDQGKNRSGGDLLTIAGYSDTNNLAAAIRWAYLFDNGRVKQRDTLTPDETLDLARNEYCASEEGKGPDLTDFVKIAGRIYQTSGQPKGMMAALLYTINKMNPAKQAEWAHAWENGIDGGKHRAIGMATKKIGEMKTVGGRVHDVVRAALLVKAWNMYATGRGRKEDMIWSNEDDFPPIVSGLAA